MATLSANRGDAFEQGFGWEDSLGEPISLADYGVEFVVNNGGEEITYTSDPTVVVTPAEGQIDIYIADSVTAGWGSDVFYQLRITPPNGRPDTLVKGRIMVT